MGGHHPGIFILGCLLVAAVITLAILLYNSRRHSTHTAVAVPNHSAGAEAILNERLARGEVSVEDFTAARAALRGEVVPAAAVNVPSPPSDS